MAEELQGPGLPPRKEDLVQIVQGGIQKQATYMG
jgi:hypothetical protein